MTRNLLALAAVGLSVLAVACGEDEAAPNGEADACGQPEGVEGEIVIVQPMSCDEAVDVARSYYESGRAPGLWRSGRHRVATLSAPA